MLHIIKTLQVTNEIVEPALRTGSVSSHAWHLLWSVKRLTWDFHLTAGYVVETSLASTMSDLVHNCYVLPNKLVEAAAFCSRFGYLFFARH